MFKFESITPEFLAVHVQAYPSIQFSKIGSLHEFDSLAAYKPYEKIMVALVSENKLKMVVADKLKEIPAKPVKAKEEPAK